MQLLSIEYLIGLIFKNSCKYFDNNPVGCFLKVDLDYADKLHNLHNDIFLTAEKYANSFIKIETLP